MTLKRAIAVIVGFTAFGAGTGVGAGYFLAIVFPAYYQTVFARSDGSDVDPVSLGVGLGLTQGMALGAIIGFATVSVLCWYDLRKREMRQLASEEAY